MKKNWVVTITLLVIFFLSACVRVQQSSLPPTVFPTQMSTFQIITSSPIPPVTSIYISPTPSSTITASLTLDYAALGLPSPTATPTFDYEGLSSFYLTPFTPPPTRTGNPSLTPTANIPNMLSSVLIRNIMPQPPFVRNDSNLMAYVQFATDLMNYFNGNRESYLQYINSWSSMAFKFSDDWFLENDFDNDGLPEWLISFPAQYKDGVLHCGDFSPDYCARYFLLFEKIGDSYYPVKIFESNYEKVVLIDDLNDNHLQDILFEGDPCGTACSTYLHIVEWDGNNWKDYWMSAERSQVTFADLDSNGTIEISLKYSTGAMSKYNPPYPFREDLVDVYGWQNGRYELVDQIYPPTGSMYATIFDVAHALEYENAELALKRIDPVMESLDQSCDRMRTYVGIQAMLAYAIRDNTNEMKSTLEKLEKYCDHPRNAYIPAAKILWLAYEKSHDPIRACQAMEQFLWNEYNQENGRWSEALFIDNHPAHRPPCPHE